MIYDLPKFAWGFVRAVALEVVEAWQRREPRDPRVRPVRGDWIDELVNEQLARGKGGHW